MNRMLIVCYQKLKEIFNNYDAIKKQAQNDPQEFAKYLTHVTNQCYIEEKKLKKITTSNTNYATKDLSIEVINQFGLYGSFVKIQELFSFIPANHKLYIALKVLEASINEVLTSLLELKIPKLLELSQRPSLATVLNLLKDEAQVYYLLGLDLPQKLMEQLSFLPIEQKTSISYRRDIYLQELRKIEIDEYMKKFAIEVIGIEKFQNQMANIICLLTSSEDTPELSAAPFINALVNLVEKFSLVDTVDSNAFLSNPDQLILQLPND